MPDTPAQPIRSGATAWILAVQFFVAQVVVATAWPRPFSLRSDYISDLGNTVCGAYPAGSDRLVCSPWHAAMNASFLLLGITMMVGAILTRRAFAPGWAREVACALFVVAGVGVLLVGIYPENTDNARHVLGAGLNFVAGNVAMIVYGQAMSLRTKQGAMALLSVAAGVLGMIGTVLLVRGEYLGLGVGGMERVAAYPMTCWQIGVGLALWRQRAAA